MAIQCDKCGHEMIWFGNPCRKCNQPTLFQKGDHIVQKSGRYKWCSPEKVYEVSGREHKLVRIQIAAGVIVRARCSDFRLASDEEIEVAKTDRFMEAL